MTQLIDFINMMHDVDQTKDSIFNSFKFPTPFIFVNTTWKILQCSYKEDGKPCYIDNIQETLSVSFSDINYRCFCLKQYFMDLVNPIVSKYEGFYQHFDISFEEELEEEFDKEEKKRYYSNNEERSSIDIVKRLVLVFNTTVNVDEEAIKEFERLINEFCYSDDGLYARLQMNKQRYANFLMKVAAFNYQLNQVDIDDDDLIETDGVICLRSIFDDSTGFISSSACENDRVKYITYKSKDDKILIDLSMVANYYQIYNYLSKILK